MKGVRRALESERASGPAESTRRRPVRLLPPLRSLGKPWSASRSRLPPRPHRPVPTDADWSLRSLVAADADAVRRLWDRRFGGEATTQTRWIEAALDPDHTATATVVSPLETDRVVAFGLLEVGDPAYTRRYLSLDALGLEPTLASRNGILHMYCVHREWEGRGIGTALYAHHLRDLATRNVPRALGLAWHRPHTTDSRVLFEKHSFRCLATIDCYYSRFEQRSRCPDCGGACSCTASLYTRRVQTR